jgi:nucleoside-diphosphate-sugar epimerase
MNYTGKVLVVGASGRTGIWVMRRLQHYGIAARAYTRSAGKLAEFKSLDIASGSIQDVDKLRAAMNGCSAVICALGASSLFGESSPSAVDGDGIIRLADVAAEQGISKLIVVSTIAVTKPFHPLNLFGGVLNQKLRSENHVRDVFAEAGRTYTIIRPGGLKDGEPLQYRLKIDTGDKITGLTDRADVAELCVVSLWNPNAVNKTFEVIRDAEEKQTSLESYLQVL